MSRMLRALGYDAIARRSLNRQRIFHDANDPLTRGGVALSDREIREKYRLPLHLLLQMEEEFRKSDFSNDTMRSHALTPLQQANNI